jgi:GNAT superfamily N-acetyltransferase
MSRFLTDTLDGIEITRADDVKKHGEHDQSSHGSWAHGIQVEPEVVRSVLGRVKENGGLSVNLKDGSEPTKGFMVAKGKKYAAIVKADDFFDETKGAEILSSYMKQHKADLATGKNYLGLWHNTEDGQVYLDVSENIMDEGEATSRGRERDQISIWDVANFKEVQTGGTGGIEKTRGSRTTRFVKHDRRTDRRIRQRDLGETRTRKNRFEVIYFDYGLKPVFKHGEHDQSEHGNWARGFTDSERKLIERMDGVGPSLDDLDNVIKDKKEYTDEDKTLVVENDSDLYADATQDIDEKVAERLAKLQEEFPNHEYTEQEKATIYEDVQREMVADYVESNSDTLDEYLQASDGDTQDPAELQPFFDEVFAVEHTGKNEYGDEVTLRSTVEEVYRDGNDIMVSAAVYDEDNNRMGEVSRRFFKEGDTWNVEHALLALEDGARGTGFGKEFIKQSEAWYTAKGFGYIEVGTAWDGARHWARAGYDFRPDKLDENFDALRMNVEYTDGFERGSPARAEFDALMSRATNGYQPDFEDESGDKFPAWDSFKDMKSDNFPLPADFANIGYKPGATEWAGKTLMYGLKMKYVKTLTAEGQKLLDGPIDHDGDGMIYDGTAREKPAPSGGNK